MNFTVSLYNDGSYGVEYREGFADYVSEDTWRMIVQGDIATLHHKKWLNYEFYTDLVFNLNPNLFIKALGDFGVDVSELMFAE